MGHPTGHRPADRETGLADEEVETAEEPKGPAAPPALEPMTDIEPAPDVAAERAQTWSGAPAGG